MVEPIATCYGVRHVENIKHQLFGRGTAPF